MGKDNAKPVDASGEADSLHTCSAVVRLRIKIHDGRVEEVEGAVRQKFVPDARFIGADRNVSDVFLFRDVPAPEEGSEELAEAPPLETGKDNESMVVFPSIDSSFVSLQDFDCVVVYRKAGAFTIATDDGVIVDSASIPVGRSISAKQKRLLVCGKRIKAFGIDMGIGRQDVLATAKLTLDVSFGHDAAIIAKYNRSCKRSIRTGSHPWEFLNNCRIAR